MEASLIFSVGLVVRQRFAITDLVTTLGALCTRDQRHAPPLPACLFFRFFSFRYPPHR